MWNTRDSLTIFCAGQSGHHRCHLDSVCQQDCRRIGIWETVLTTPRGAGAILGNIASWLCRRSTGLPEELSICWRRGSLSTRKISLRFVMSSLAQYHCPLVPADGGMLLAGWSFGSASKNESDGDTAVVMKLRKCLRNCHQQPPTCTIKSKHFKVIAPTVLHVNVNLRCNTTCAMCNIWGSSVARVKSGTI
jgi:hypothetical protein